MPLNLTKAMIRTIVSGGCAAVLSIRSGVAIAVSVCPNLSFVLDKGGWAIFLEEFLGLRLYLEICQVLRTIFLTSDNQ